MYLLIVSPLCYFSAASSKFVDPFQVNEKHHPLGPREADQMRAFDTPHYKDNTPRFRDYANVHQDTRIPGKYQIT